MALLEALQALARADAAEAVPREPVDVAELVDASVLAARRRHPSVTLFPRCGGKRRLETASPV